MYSLFAALVFAVVIATGDTCERHGAKCPDYTVVKTNEEYEERQYPSLVWVSATEYGKSKSEVSRKLIKQLYAYLGGANDKGNILEMTVPVRTAKMVQEGHNSYTMAIALTPDQNASPPLPTDPALTVSREPATTYVARSFSGMARQESIWDGHAEALKTALSTDTAVNTTFYYICAYDSPWRETDRLNEVWMVKT